MGPTSADEVRSLSGAASVFWRRSSPRVIAVGLSLAVGARLLLADGSRWDRWDALAVGTVAALTPVVEWIVHRYVLHITPQRIGSTVIDPGAGHREHHRQPNSIGWILLRGQDAALFQVANAALVAAILWPVLWMFGVSPARPILTGVVSALLALAHYEWAHFLFHTAYRPKTRYYQRLKQNHRLHHWRNEHYWLGITSNGGDRLARTYPASRSAVPLSATARTLGSDPVTPSGAERGRRR